MAVPRLTGEASEVAPSPPPLLAGVAPVSLSPRSAQRLAPRRPFLAGPLGRPRRESAAAHSNAGRGFRGGPAAVHGGSGHSGIAVNSAE